MTTSAIPLLSLPTVQQRSSEHCKTALPAQMPVPRIFSLSQPGAGAGQRPHLQRTRPLPEEQRMTTSAYSVRSLPTVQQRSSHRIPTALPAQMPVPRIFSLSQPGAGAGQRPHLQRTRPSPEEQRMTTSAYSVRSLPTVQRRSSEHGKTALPAQMPVLRIFSLSQPAAGAGQRPHLQRTRPSPEEQRMTTSAYSVRSLPTVQRRSSHRMSTALPAQMPVLRISSLSPAGAGAGEPPHQQRTRPLPEEQRMTTSAGSLRSLPTVQQRSSEHTKTALPEQRP